MRSRDPYVNLLTKAVIDLVASGVRDPSVSEIAAKAFPSLIQPPHDPLDQPPGLGGEVYDGIAKRLGKIRLELEESEGRLAATINSRYYQLGFRHNDHITSAQAAIVLPAAGNKAQGIRMAVDGENDPIYLEWQRANGKAGSTRVGRASTALDAAHTNGIVTTNEGVGALTDFSHRLGTPTGDRILQIQQRKLNGTGQPTP
jgi:hypothetical protein